MAYNFQYSTHLLTVTTNKGAVYLTELGDKKITILSMKFCNLANSNALDGLNENYFIP